MLVSRISEGFTRAFRAHPRTATAVEQCQLEMSEPIYLTDDLCEPCAVQNQLFLDSMILAHKELFQLPNRSKNGEGF